MTPASDQRDRCFAWFSEEMSRDDRFPPCFARIVLPNHTACKDTYGNECHPRELQCSHLLGKSFLESRIKGMRASGHRHVGHPLLTADLDEVIFDWRNAVPNCPLAHHQWDYAGKRPLYDQLPPHFHDFLDEWRIWHWAEDLYPRSGGLGVAA